MTLDEDQTRTVNPAPNAAGWDFDSDLDDAMLTDEEDDAPQQLAPQDQYAGGNNWSPLDGDDGDSLTSMWRQFSPVLMPIPFALIIFLFALLASSHGVANLAPLPLGIILLALAVIQGTALYYSGNNETLWMLSLMGGYLLFLLVGAFVFFGLGGAVLLLLILLLLSAIFGGRVIRQVPEGRVDLVQQFGRYHRTLYPGLNLLFPWERIYAHVRTKEITWTTPAQRITTSHNQVVDIVASVTYQLLPEDAHIAVTHVEDWETDLHEHFLSVLKSVVYELKPADLIGWAHEIHSRPRVMDELANPMTETRWDRLNAALLRRLQDLVATRGIKINMVHTQDITVISQYPSPSQAIPVDAGMVRGQPARPVQPASKPPSLPPRQAEIAAQSTAPAPATQHAAAPMPATVPMSAPAPAPAPEPASPVALNDVKMQSMIEAFNAIREGRITDPTTIYSLAERFEAIANNPELDRVFPYDARQAAKALKERATYIKVSREIEARRTSAPASANPAPLERAARRLPTPSNDNLEAGG